MGADHWGYIRMVDLIEALEGAEIETQRMNGRSWPSGSLIYPYIYFRATHTGDIFANTIVFAVISCALRHIPYL
jgi:hypothetical protein